MCKPFLLSHRSRCCSSMSLLYVSHYIQSNRMCANTSTTHIDRSANCSECRIRRCNKCTRMSRGTLLVCYCVWSSCEREIGPAKYGTFPRSFLERKPPRGARKKVPWNKQKQKVPNWKLENKVNKPTKQRVQRRGVCPLFPPRRVII